MKRFVSALSLVLVLCLLCSCGRANHAGAPETQLSTAPTEVPQEAMEQSALEQAVRRLEYSLLASAFVTQGQLTALESQYNSYQTAFIGDVDKDGCEEFICGGNPLIFESKNGPELRYFHVQSGYDYYTDKDGNYYSGSSVSGSYEDGNYPGNMIYNESGSEWINRWSSMDITDTVGESDRVYARSHEFIQEVYYAEDGSYSKGAILKDSQEYAVNGTAVTKADYDAHQKELGLTQIDTDVTDLIGNTYSAAYRDSLIAGLDSYLKQNYSQYTQPVTADYDGDGYAETFLIVPELTEHWFNALEQWNSSLSVELYGDIRQTMAYILPMDQARVGVLIVDQADGQLTVDARCLLGNLSVQQGMDISLRQNCLFVDSLSLYAPAAFTTLEDLQDSRRADVYAGLSNHLATAGYTSCVIRLADLSEHPGSEVLCLCQKDGVWYLYIFRFENGQPIALTNMQLNSRACYLIEVNGKTYILEYQQDMYMTMGGDTCNNYSYRVYRFAENGDWDILDEQYVTYYGEDVDATQTANFFQALNKYLVKIIVICDPFQLTGNMWLAPQEAEHGTPPAEPEQPEQAEEETPKLGFVEIQDPSSWLHLREGPGLEYAKVLFDPADPDSFVRQALGSPVTVLERAETDDPENPVWLKIRIQYLEKEIIGWSSKTYIRLQGE